MANKIKVEDFVVVESGKWAGHKGRVLGIHRRDDEGKSARITIEGIEKTVHVKPNPSKDQKGGIEKRPASIDISNVALYDESSQAKVKVAISKIDGKNQRVNKQTGGVIDAPKKQDKKEST